MKNDETPLERGQWKPMVLPSRWEYSNLQVYRWVPLTEMSTVHETGTFFTEKRDHSLNDGFHVVSLLLLFYISAEWLISSMKDWSHLGKEMIFAFKK